MHETQEIGRHPDHNHQEEMAPIENTGILDGRNGQNGMDPQNHTRPPMHATKKFQHRLPGLVVTDRWIGATRELSRIDPEALLHSSLRQLLQDPWIQIMVD
jgi:hypothetical protein